MREPVVYEITAIRYATLACRRSELFHRYETYGEPDAPAEMSYFFWLLRSATQTILVDTGFDPDVGRRRGRTALCAPVDALRRLGVEPNDVSAVIVTHFHYDHVGNLDAFPSAALVVPARELEFWTGPLARRRQFASLVEREDIAAIERAQRDGRVRLTDGVEEVFGGVTTHCVGGHSPGQLVTVVAAAGGDVVLASDAVHFYEELELDRPFVVIADLAQMHRAYDRVGELAAAAAVMVPGHDGRVLERFPPAEPDLEGNAVRLG